MKYGSRNESPLHETGLRLLPQKRPARNIWKYIVLTEVVLVLLLILNFAAFNVRCGFPSTPDTLVVVCRVGGMGR